MDATRHNDERLRRRERLARTLDIKAVFAGRTSAAGGRVVVYGLPNALEYNRLGIVVSRRLGGAVQRNRFKRRVREAFRRTKLDQPSGWDWLVLPRLPKKGNREQGIGNSRTAKVSSEPLTGKVPTKQEELEVLKKELLSLMRRVARMRSERGGRRNEQPKRR